MVLIFLTLLHLYVILQQHGLSVDDVLLNIYVFYLSNCEIIHGEEGEINNRKVVLHVKQHA